MNHAVAFPAFYRSGPCSARFTPGFVTFRIRARDTASFKKGTLDLTSVQYLICNAVDGEIEFAVAQAKDLFVGMSASRRMENRHVVLCAGGNLWRDIGDLKSWTDEVDRAGLSGEMVDALAHVVAVQNLDCSSRSVEVTKAFDAEAFAAIDRVVPFSIVPSSPSFCATTIAPKKYAGAKFSPEAIGMAAVTAEQREKLISSRKRRRGDDAAQDARPSKRREQEQERGREPVPPPVEPSLEELLGLTDSDSQPADPRPFMNLEEILAADEDDSTLPILPEIRRNAAAPTSLQDDLDFIFEQMSA